MKKTLLMGLTCGICLLIGLSGLEAQFTGREITGYVRAAGYSGAPPGTVVQLQLVGGGTDQQVNVDSSGRFQFQPSSGGLYYVVAKAPGYREVSQRVDLITNIRLSVHLNLVPDRDETSPHTNTTPAVTQRQLQIPEKALKEFERGARELMQSKKPKEALPRFHKAIEIYPDYYEAYELIGTAHMDLQEWAKAEEALKGSLRINGEYAPSLIALGAVYNRQGRFAEALPLLQKAGEIEPDSWLCHLELAQCLLPLGKVAEAEPHARLAHEKNPDFPLVHLAMANLGLAKGDLALGREECDHFLKLVPNGPLAEMVKAKVKEIDALLAEEQKAKP